jgi:drug/metabolite transporter (DMT)-like permease
MKSFAICGNQTLTIHGLMVLTTVLVSTSFPVVGIIANTMDPVILTLVRFALAAIVFLPVMIWQHGWQWPGHARLSRYALISLTLVCFFWCMFEALRYTSALNTSALYTLIPGISGLYSRILLKEKLGINRYLALFVGLIGALWIVFRGDWRRFVTLEFNYGDLIFLVGCFFMGLYTPLVKKFHRKESMVVMTFWVLLLGTVWLLLLVMLRTDLSFGGGNWEQARIGILYLAVFTTVITFFLLQFCTIRIGPTRVMAYGYLYPALIVVWDRLLGKPSPQPITYIGIIVVLLATVFLQSERNSIAKG